MVLSVLARGVCVLIHVYKLCFCNVCVCVCVCSQSQSVCNPERKDLYNKAKKDRVAFPCPYLFLPVFRYAIFMQGFFFKVYAFYVWGVSFTFIQ